MILIPRPPGFAAEEASSGKREGVHGRPQPKICGRLPQKSDRQDQFPDPPPVPVTVDMEPAWKCPSRLSCES